MASELHQTVAAALGRAHRQDPHLPQTGGPAGNARLTGWLGLALLVLFLAELATLLDVRGLISWHIVIGALLLPPALAKTGSTGWRILRYYAGSPPYRSAGPPPLLLRVLGPFVVLGTLLVLGSGIALVWLGEQTSRQVLLTVAGHRVDAVTVHQACFIAWGVVTGLHVLARTVPAIRLTVAPVGEATYVAGTRTRLVALAVTAVAAAVTGALLLGAAGSWRSGFFSLHHDHEGLGVPALLPTRTVG